jgi:hypothetical protein
MRPDRPDQPAARTWAGVRSVFKHWKVAVVGLALAGLVAGFVWCYPSAAPVHPGKADEFWYAATKVRIVEGRQHDTLLEALYEVKDGACYYYRNSPREQIVYSVSLGDVQRDLAALVTRIDEPETAKQVPSWVKQGETLWTESDPERQDAGVFIRCIGVKRQHWLEKEQGSQLSLVRLREAAVKDRRVRAGWYPFVAAGELLYLAALVLFVAWPLFRESGPASWAVHLGLFPILLFLPFWLGYGSWSFSPVSLKGGVLYPRLLAPLDFVPWTNADSSIASMLPTTLDTVAPIDTTVKAQRVLRGGPSLVLASGLAVALTTYGLRNMRRLRLRALRRRRRRERAVEKQGRAERMREWEVHRAEVLAEVSRIIEDEILPAFERRLRTELNGTDERDATNEDVDFYDADREASSADTIEDGIASRKRVHIVNDIPFPFERALPTVPGQPAAPAVASAPAAPPPEATAAPEPVPHESAAAPQAEASHQ